MKNVNWAQKLTSRKLWMALVGVIVGVALAFGVEGSEIENMVGMISGAIAAVGSIVGYIHGEAKADAAGAKSTELAALLGSGDAKDGEVQ